MLPIDGVLLPMIVGMVEWYCAQDILNNNAEDAANPLTHCMAVIDGVVEQYHFC